MGTTEIEIIKEIAENLGINPEDIEMDALIREDLGLNTIELNDLLSSISKKFKVSFDPAEIQSLRSIEDLVNMIEDALIDSEL